MMIIFIFTISEESEELRLASLHYYENLSNDLVYVTFSNDCLGFQRDMLSMPLLPSTRFSVSSSGLNVRHFLARLFLLNASSQINALFTTV